MKYQEIKVDRIVTRKKVRGDKSDRTRFRQSLKAIGIVHAPIVVRRDRSRFDLVAGRSRLAAAKKAGKKIITCQIIDAKTLDDDRARLIYIDENVVRTELPEDVYDQLIVERQKILERLCPEETRKEKQKAGGRKGGKTAGRGRPKKAGTESVPPKQRPSRKSAHIRETEAKRRKNDASAGAWQLYSEGKLKQSQMDEIVKLPELVQEGIARRVVGQTITETRAIVRAANAKIKAPSKQAEALSKAMAKVDKTGGAFVDAASYCQELLGEIEGLNLGPLGLKVMRIRLELVLSAAEQLLKEISNEPKKAKQLAASTQH